MKIKFGMSNFVLEIWDDETEKVTFYSVRLESNKNNETDNFFDKYSKIDRLKESTQDLLSFIP